MHGVSPDLQDLLIKEAVFKHPNDQAWLETRKQVLRELQALKLEQKVWLTEKIFQQAVHTFGPDHLYLSFSGGKDSTVLSHIIRQAHPQLLHLFVDTSCEYPETLAFISEMLVAGVNIQVVTPTDRSGCHGPLNAWFPSWGTLHFQKQSQMEYAHIVMLRRTSPDKIPLII